MKVLKLSELGIRVTDERGELRKFEDIHKDLVKVYENIQSANVKARRIIGGGRCRGKTTKLIEKSHEDWKHIVLGSSGQARMVAKQARDMGLDIPYPITAEELIKSNVQYGKRIEDVLVDEIEIVFRELTGVNVLMASTSYELDEMEELNKERL